MMIEQINATIAVHSAHLYRAESVAIALARSEIIATVVQERVLEILGTYEIVLIDLDCEMNESLQLTRHITYARPQTKVILLGVTESEDNVLKLAEFGAAGYVSAASSLQELVKVVQSVQKGEFACAPHITYALFSHLAELAASSAPILTEGTVLTARERQVMNLLSESHSNKEIARRLCLSEHTVKNHVHHLLKKLGMRNRNFATRVHAYPQPSRISESAISQQ